MSTSETFQITAEAAEVYERRFVPAIFAQWAPVLLDAAGVGPGHRVLDVACGTGIVARHARERVGSAGSVVGVDLNPAMLDVARRLDPFVTWRRADAAELPFEGSSFDVVACQMALMFFGDRVAALAEMGRVATAGGTVAVVVPAALADQPAYGPLVEVAARHAGPEAVSLLGAYWSCGDLDQLTGWLRAAGLEPTGRSTRTGTAHFATSDDLVATEVEATPLVERIDATTYDRIRTDAGTALAPFVTAGGTLEAPLRCHVVTARPADR